MVLACLRKIEGALFGEPILNQTVKHHWYGDTSPWSGQRSENPYGFSDPLRQSTAPKTVILDREHPPQLRSGRAAED
jgi:hypothetical protein